MGNVVERHKYILEQLRKDGYVRVRDLSLELDVSEVTIRKDLKHLEGRKLLLLNHGGASRLTSLIEDRHIDEKEKLFVDEKIRISKAANELLEPNDKVIIASGTTLLSFAKDIFVDFPIKVITSSVKVSLTLCYNHNIDVIQLGGAMRKNSVSVVGFYAENMLDGLSCNKLFLGVDGIDIEHGLTTSDLAESRINQEMIEVSQKIIVLTDSSKFGKRGFSKICSIDKIHHIITDNNAPGHIVEMMRERGIEVTLV